jgi:hypothetical protein
MMFFGRPGGPARTVLALVAVGVLGLLSVVIFNLNGSLDDQQRVNATSVGVSQSFLDVNDQLTDELGDLTKLTGAVQTALDSIKGLQPILGKLHDAIAPVAASLSSTAQGAQLTADQLGTIAQLLGQVHDVVAPLVESAKTFGDQGKALLAMVDGLVADLQATIASVATINQMLPLPG